MCEFRRDCSSFYSREDFNACNGIGFKFHRVAYGCGDCVPSHVEVTEVQLSNTSVRCAKLRCSNNLVDDFLRNFFTGNIVLCKAVEEFLLSEVILVELRRQLNKVVADTCARQRSIFAVGEQSVQGVAKFVEECFHFVER